MRSTWQTLQLAVAERETFSRTLATPDRTGASQGWQPPDWLRAWRGSAWVAVLLAVAFALAARLGYFAGSNFPLNDGGMFVAMARDLVANHFALPATTTYNFEHVPFAYPPVAFYLLAGLSALTGQNAISLDRWLPLVANLGTVALVALLARGLLRGWAALLGGIIFALIPRSYEWTMMGGGLTRSFGFLFAAACLVVALQLFRRPTPLRFAAVALLAGLSLATHLEFGLFVAYSLVLLAICEGPHRWRALLLTALAGLVALTITAPWWATVIVRDGLGPFQAASDTGEWTSFILQMQALEDFITPPKLLLSMPATLAVLGVLASLVRGKWFLPLWLPIIFLLNPRSAPTEAALPLALLAAIGFTEVVWPGLSLAVARARGASALFAQVRAVALRIWRVPRASLGMGGVALALTLLAVYLAWPSMHPNRHALDVLSPQDQVAMAWVARQTPLDESFLVLTDDWTWENDHVSEWFPVLAQRHSVLTVQATEWLPDSQYARERCLYNNVREFGSLEWGVSSVDQWASDRGVVYSAIYISPSVVGPLDWRPLVASAQASPNYTVSYDQDGVTILQRTTPIQPRWPAAGPLLVADDCSSLSEQPQDTIRAWEAYYGPQAARDWVNARNTQINPPLNPLAKLGAFLFQVPPQYP